MGDFKQRRLAAAPRVLHPSEDLSELPPLRSVVARQAYHYRLAGSSQNSLPKLLPAGWDRSSPYWAVFMQKQCFPHRWSSRILRIAVPFLAHPLDVIQSLDMYFSSCMRWTENVPSLLIGIKSRLFTTSFEKFFNFFQNSSFALADSLLPDMHDPRNLLLRFLILIPQCQQDFLFHG